MAELLLDAGNTRIKWALRDEDGQFVARGALPTSEASSLAGALGAVAASRAIFVSVASDEVNRQIEESLRAVCGDAWSRFVSTPQVGALRNDYARPEQLGADRLAAALGAWQRRRDNCLVVNCGTATTIDVVEKLEPGSAADSRRLQKKSANAAVAAQARFAGGVILPGFALMKSALCRHTARLPDAAGELVAIPDNTDDAITSGCLLAQCGAVEAMWRRFVQPVPVLLAGGAAADLQPLLAARGMAVIEAPELVLEGLAVAILQRFS